jgi:phosphopantetheinyl transferase (holo-ACP synthase)
MRFAAAAALGRANVCIDYPDNSPPRLATASDRPAALSLSHCDQTVAVVVADHPVIGCDVLSLARAVDWKGIAASFFNEDDYKWVMATPDNARERFGALWCIKEAVAKCSGAPLLKCLRASRPMKKSLVDAMQGENRLESAAYTTVREHFEPIFNAAARRQRLFHRPASGRVSDTSRYWTQSGTVADCSFAVASDVPLAIDVLKVPIETL